MELGKPIVGQSLFASLFQNISNYKFVCAALSVAVIGLGAANARADIGPGPAASPWMCDASASLGLPTCAPAVFETNAASRPGFVTFTGRVADAADLSNTLQLDSQSMAVAEVNGIIPTTLSPAIALLAQAPSQGNALGTWESMREVVNLQALIGPEIPGTTFAAFLLPADASISFFAAPAPALVLGPNEFLDLPRRANGEVADRT